MKIARYVGELLFDYECVVIPGLGGFIAEDKPVVINKVTDKFSPPFRKIHFNIHLRANDGLLINFVAQQENIGYKTAKQRVDKFVFLCHNALEQGKKINFKHIGSIYYDAEKNVSFDQDNSINYNADSFGLTSLVSPSIRRPSDEEKIKKVVKSAIDSTKGKKKTTERVDKKEAQQVKPVKRVVQARYKQSPLTNQIIFLAVVMFFMSLGYVYVRRHAMSYYAERYASYIPFFYSSVNDYLASNINSTHVAKLSRGTASFFPFVLDKDNNLVPEQNKTELEVDDKDGQVSIIPVDVINVAEEDNPNNITVGDEEVINDQPVELIIHNTEPAPEEEVVVIVPNSKPAATRIVTDKYFIIAGSFSKESNAKKLVNELKMKGYNAMIADTNKYGMFRVAFRSFNNRSVANKELLAIREDASPTAWLLVKK